jgi:hypothetical protein
MNDADWQALLATPRQADPGFTLRVLTALPPARPGRERLRAGILLLALALAALLVALVVTPAVVELALALAGPPRLAGFLLGCAGVALLVFWSVLTVAD